MISSTIRAFTCLIVLPAILLLLLFGCRDTEPEQETALTAEMPLHLEEHLDTANIEGSEVPADVPKPVQRNLSCCCTLIEYKQVLICRGKWQPKWQPNLTFSPFGSTVWDVDL